MKRMRRIHLLVGCLVSPLLLLFAVSGPCQVLALHRGLKDGTYTPSAIVSVLSSLHKNEYFDPRTEAYRRCAGVTGEIAFDQCMRQHERPTTALRLKSALYSALLVLCGLGLFVNAATGLWMALRLKASRRPAAILALIGVLAPLLLTLL